MKRISRLWLLAGLAALMLAVAGCASGGKGDSGTAGTDGSNGMPGSPGAPGTSLTQASLTATVINATVPTDGKPVITFEVRDQDNQVYADLGNGTSTTCPVSACSQVRFNIAKLIPGSTGNVWQNYILTTATSGGTIALQATQERTRSGSAWGTLAYSNGVYTYTFGTNIKSVAAPSYTLPVVPVDVTYNGTLTHRVSIQISGNGLPSDVVTNATYDFVPNGGAVTTTHDVVKTDTCNQCHNQLALHGGSRIEVKLCVTCHNPGSYDATTGNVVDMKVFIHRIHFGSGLPSVTPVAKGGNGTAYAISSSDFSGGVLPQMIPTKKLLISTGDSSVFFPTCTKCHVESDPAVANADSWRKTPSIETCTSCHDDVVFDGSIPAGTKSGWQRGHTDGQKTNAQCAFCHASGSLTADIDKVHGYPTDLAAEVAKYQFTIESFSYSAKVPKVTFSVKNPSTGVYYDIGNVAALATTGPFAVVADTSAGSTGSSTISAQTASISAYLGWGAKEHTNGFNGSSSAPGSGISASVLTTAVVGTRSAACGTTTKCTFQVAFSALSTEADAAAVAAGGFVVGFSGRVQADLKDNTPASANAAGYASVATFKSRVPVKADVKYYDTAGVALAAADSRRVVASAANCDNCHAQVQAHGGARVDNVQLCVICHNANNTDVSNRNINDPGTSVDGKKEQSVDFKVFIHGLHAGTTAPRTTPFSVSGTDFSGVEFPGQLNRCTNCHTSSGYALPISSAATATTTNSNPLAATVLAARSKTFGALSFSQGTAAVPPTTSPIDLATGAIAITNHGLVTGDSVTLSVTGTATMPTGLPAGSYFVAVVDNSHFTLNSGGPAIVPSALGVGSVSIVTPTSVNAGTDTIQFKGHGLVTDQVVRFSAGKYGLATNTDYYVLNTLTVNTFQVSQIGVGGAVFDLTADVTSPAVAVIPKGLLQPSDNGRTSSMAAVCSSCHDDSLPIQHMKLQGAAFTSDKSSVANPFVDDGSGNVMDGSGTVYIETCPICHGPGTLADVKVMHKVP